MFEKISGKKIKEALKAAKLTQIQAAQKLGCDQSFISQMINEKTNISLNNLKKISEMTGKPLNFFVDRDSITNNFLGNNNTTAENNSRMDLIEEKMRRLETENDLLKKEIELLKIKIEKN